MTTGKPRGMAGLYARLEALPVPPTTPDTKAAAAAFVARGAANDDERVMLRQMLGFDWYPRPTLSKRHRKNAATHGTEGAVRFHQEHGSRLCRLCARWVYAHDVHGTEQACQAHYADGTPLCKVCQRWSDERHRRARVPAGSSCGSAAGFRRHVRLGERICGACRSANAQNSIKRRLRDASPEPAPLIHENNDVGSVWCSSGETSPDTGLVAGSTGSGFSNAQRFRPLQSSWAS